MFLVSTNLIIPRKNFNCNKTFDTKDVNTRIV